LPYTPAVSRSSSGAPHGRRPGRHLLCAATTLAVLLLASDGRAAPPSRAGVARFTGPGGAQIRRQVTRTLEDRGFKVVSLDALERAATLLAVSPDEEHGIQAVAAKLALATAVTGHVVGDRRLHAVRIAVHDVRTGRVLAEATFSAPTTDRLARTVGRDLWARLGTALAAATVRPPSVGAADTSLTGPTPGGAPPLASPPPTVSAQPEPTRPPQAGILTAGPTKFELCVGPRVVYRRLAFDTDPDNALTPFHTRQPAPAVGLEAAWVPRLSRPRLGLAVSFEYGAPVKASSGSGLVYRMPNSDLNASLLVGYPFRLFTLDFVAGGGSHRFAANPEGAAVSRPRTIPGVAYSYVRVGVAARVYPASRIGLQAAVYYRHVLEAGAIASSDWFPSVQTRGAEATVGISYRFLPMLEARLQGNLRLYRLAMDPQAPPGGHVAAGAQDQYWNAWLAMALLFGGGVRGP
jgi:hypothetical protein